VFVILFVVVVVAVAIDFVVPIRVEYENEPPTTTFLIIVSCLVEKRFDRDDLVIAPRLAIEVSTLRRKFMLVVIVIKTLLLYVYVHVHVHVYMYVCVCMLCYDMLCYCICLPPQQLLK